MAYSKKTWANQEKLTAAKMNAYVRDNFEAGVPDVFEAAGDLAVASGADAATRLAVGAAYQVLTADPAAAAKMKWIYPQLQYCIVQRSGGTAVLSGTRDVAWNAEVSDPQGWHNNVTDNHLIKPTEAGIYLVGARLRSESAWGITGARLVIDDINVIDQMKVASGVIPAGGILLLALAGVTAGDFKEFKVEYTASSSSGAIDDDSMFWVLRVG